MKMYRVPPARAWWPAVGAPLERGVMPRLRATSVVGHFCRPGRDATPSRLTAEQGRYSAAAASATAQRLDARDAMNCSDVGPVAELMPEAATLLELHNCISVIGCL